MNRPVFPRVSDFFLASPRRDPRVTAHRVDRQLRQLVTRIDATVPFYRELWREAGFDPRSVTGTGDLPAIIATYAEDDGHLNFNGVIYKTEEQLTAFHKGFGFSNEGMLSGIGGDITHITYTQKSMIVEYALRATIEIDLPDAPRGRSVAIPMCVLYEFDEAGKLTSERVYTDTAALLPKPLVQL